MTRRVLVTLVLAALTAGPWLRWPCVHSCAPDSQRSVAASECHRASAPATRVSAAHNCDADRYGFTVVVKRSESISPGIAIPSAGIDAAAGGRPLETPAIDRTAASPPTPSWVVPLRI